MERVALPGERRPGSQELSFKDVGFAYGEQTVLSDLNFTIGRTSKILLRGRNGSGKSTVANIRASFLPPSSGEAKTFNLERVSACLNPQHFIPGSLRNNLDFEGLSGPRRRALLELAREFDLEELLDKDPEELSTGQRKKAEILMGLMKDADLYVFDEPPANVDAPSKAKIMGRLFERTRDKALVVVMHGDGEFGGRFDAVIDLPSPMKPLVLA